MMSLRIMVVDDDVDYLEQTRLMLESRGYAVVTAQSVKEARDVFTAQQPDIAILDLMLENADGGFQLCHFIKSTRPTTPVMIVTAVASETGMDFGAANSEERGWIKADALLAKPLRAEQLEREIHRLHRPTPAPSHG